MISGYLTVLLIGLAGASWTDAETIDVEQRGTVDLKPFACHDITRSSIINRVCYDAADRAMIVQLNSVYFQHCDMPQSMLDSLLNAPSMGQYYKSKIASPGADGRYDCLTHRASKP